MRNLAPARLLQSGRPKSVCHQCQRQCQRRAIQISAAPATETPRVGGDALAEPIGASADLSDARFQVLGSQSSLLSVSLSASQTLYTRRGTLAAVVGKPENAQSTLTLLNPLGRAPIGVPFLYQRISSTTRVEALIATKSANTTFTVISLDGTTDWIVSQRPALLAWTGHTLKASPRLQLGLSFAHWGNTFLTGRGLAALAAPGQTYKVTLAEGEDFVAHPSHVVAYTVGKSLPSPVKLRGASLRFQIPGITGWLDGIGWVKQMRQSAAYGYLAKAAFFVRTQARTWIWGDGLLLQFKGPTTLYMSSRGARVVDALTSQQVNEIADSEAGSIPKVTANMEAKMDGKSKDEPTPIKMEASSKSASMDEGNELKEFVR